MKQMRITFRTEIRVEWACRGRGNSEKKPVRRRWETARRFEVVDGIRNGLVRSRGCARELHADETVETDVVERAEDGPDVHVALAEEQMLVDSPLHVLNRDGTKVGRTRSNGRLWLPLLSYNTMTCVEGELKTRNLILETIEVINGLDQHPWLWLECGRNIAFLGCFHDLTDSFHKPRPRRVRVDTVLRPSGPEGHGLPVADRRHVERPLQELDPTITAILARVDERRLVLLPRVEEKPRPSLYDEAQSQLVEA